MKKTILTILILSFIFIGCKSKPQEDKRSEINQIPNEVEEKEVFFGKDGSQLPGTLTFPKDEIAYPIVILVHGSGPNDRDETIGANKPFRDIAWQLAEEGIASLRYDKRTKVYPEGFINKDNFTVYDETIEDVGLAKQYLLSQEKFEARDIYILGHSLGGYLMPRIAKEAKDVGGYIILAGSARPLEDLMVEQIDYIANLDGKISKQEEEMIGFYRDLNNRIKSLSITKEYTVQELGGAPKGYWLDLKDYFPAEEMKEVDQVVLVLQGERDYQVTLTDFNLWKAALESKQNVELRTYKDLNHLFIYGEKVSAPEEYSVAGKVDQAVTKDISNWIKENKQ